MKPKYNVVIIEIIAVTILVLSGITYAYFSANISGEESISTISVTGGTLSISMDGGNEIGVDKITPSAASVGTKTFTVTGNNTTDMDMFYKVSLVIENNTFSTGALSYSLTGTGTNGELINDSTNESIATGSSIIDLGIGNFSNAVTNEEHIYSLNIYFLKKDADQNTDQGKSMNAHLKIVDAKAPEIASSYIKSINGMTSGSGQITYAKRAATAQTPELDEYRYTGSNPNNYVSFNNELWRIIGSFMVETPIYTDGTITSYNTEERVKIIRSSSLNNTLSWDTSASTMNSGYGVNAWNMADLMTLLNPGYEGYGASNSLYWNRQSGLAYYGMNAIKGTHDFRTTGLLPEAKEYLEESKYYTAQFNEPDLNSNRYTYLTAYTTERGTSLYSSSYGDKYTRTKSWTGYIGLMYPSDFGLSIGTTTCDNAEIAFNTARCSSWLSLPTGRNEWTIASSLDANYDSFAKMSNNVIDNTPCYQQLFVRPVTYLKASVKIKDGEGTETNPFILSL